MMPTATNGSGIAAPTGKRTTTLVLAALLIFGLVWWFLPTPHEAAKSVNAPTPAPAAASTAATAEIVHTTTAVMPARALMNTQASVPTAPHVLGPSKGSFMEIPKPRDMVESPTLLAKLDPLDRKITSLSVEEAEWMDLQGFPTLEEINSIDPESLESRNDLGHNVSIRAMAIQAAIFKRRGDPRWKDRAWGLLGLGCPFGTRLLMDDMMAQEFSRERDRSLMFLTQLGMLLGDSYVPYNLRAGRVAAWETSQVINNFATTVNTLQQTIPTARAQAGLPPLQVTRIPPNHWTGRQ